MFTTLTPLALKNSTVAFWASAARCINSRVGQGSGISVWPNSMRPFVNTA